MVFQTTILATPVSSSTVNEDDALGRARPLADQDEPGDIHPPPRLHLIQRRRLDDAEIAQVPAQKGDRVRLQRKGQEAIVVHHLLALRHVGQRAGLRGAGPALGECKERQVLHRLVQPLHRPERGAALETHVLKGVGIGQPLQGAAGQAAALAQIVQRAKGAARLARLDQSRHVRVAQALHLPKAEAQRMAGADRAGHLAMARVHVARVEAAGLQRRSQRERLTQTARTSTPCSRASRTICAGA